MKSANIIVPFIVGVALVAMFGIGQCKGKSSGKHLGWLEGRSFCENSHEVKKAKQLQILKEQAVFDFGYCSFGESGHKAITVKDISVVRSLKHIEHYEVRVCNSGSYWYRCNSVDCYQIKNRHNFGMLGER